MLTRDKGNALQRSFRRGPFSKLELVVGEEVAPQDATPEMLHEKVMALRGEWK
jgi:hypothetical protein